jgi:hypothetical protein
LVRLETAQAVSMISHIIVDLRGHHDAVTLALILALLLALLRNSLH